MDVQVFVGFDSREAVAYEVCVQSLRERSARRLPVTPLLEPHLRATGLYRRVHERRDGRLWDRLSGAPMSTEFALTRFLVPQLAEADWALYCDCDFLWRADPAALFALADPRFAVMVVPHEQHVRETVKMDGQLQLAYRRKNWSSLMLWNCRHPAHAPLAEALHRWPGRQLHGFDWLADELIGMLPEAWNWLEGYSAPGIDARAVHFTRGTPDLPGYEEVPYAAEWHAVRERVGGR
ncbi:glycosyltransferase [Pseudorhodoferax sp.]|uniref:glycosyltransferase n=1 Tax=Pseudorhodoferax sp. TaxID=1993553 RepID=UPI002DD671C1|nr:glycosyltransferase [Pseudorhodoferax sp.]